MRTKNIFLLYMGLCGAAVWNSLDALQLTDPNALKAPLSEIDFNTLTQGEIDQLPPVQLLCFTQLIANANVRQEPLKKKVVESPAYAAYYYTRTAVRSLQVASITTLIAAGMRSVYDLASPYILGVIGRYPSASSTLEKLVEKLPTNDYAFPVTALVAGAVAGGLYAGNRLLQPRELDEKTLEKVTLIDEARTQRLNTEQALYGLEFDGDMIVHDDFNLVKTLLPVAHQNIIQLQSQTDQSYSDEQQARIDALMTRSSKAKNLVKGIVGIAQAQQTIELSKQNELAERQDMQKKSKARARLNQMLPEGMLTSIGLIGMGSQSGLTSTKNILQAVRGSTTQSLALISGGLYAAFGHLEENITKKYHTALVTQLQNEERAEHTRFQETMFNLTNEKLAYHQGEIRTACQSVETISDVAARLNTTLSQRTVDIDTLLHEHEQALDAIDSFLAKALKLGKGKKE